ncbi:peptidoglycan D,D-transpeptidase FtsI family protein [Candidatus Methylomicrobium oryzae]|jgi:cell division protein FtsI (penicillin-binding protein 3)|uniref:peptidoglycan D,D-transpeptidase FtsI family protein n=1 Tax=Candidatus Methylomicrobium oryzae TaxID=2802053 RepID=UPI001920F7CB|nr:penicillin-binding transpeptidase domain-containing protein [Methylomicrobium sp. RS1]MBL1263168.1 penicillin-binding protein 2 [Methylomicrobium sp. RS1]
MRDFRGRAKSGEAPVDCGRRRNLLVLAVMLCMAALVVRAIDLQVFDRHFLQQQGSKTYVTDVVVPAYRGMIRDRNGEPLAVSTPMQSVWVNAKDHHQAEQDFEDDLKKRKKSPEEAAILLEDYRRRTRDAIREMERLLDLPAGKVAGLLNDNPKRQFAYVIRRIEPPLAERVKNLKIVGVNFEREFKRFYPTGAVSAHVVGFTDLNDGGQEGIEKGYEDVLKGVPGRKRVIRDGKQHIIEDVENISDSAPGRDLELSIDQRIQYIAYKELQRAVAENNAKSASLVVLDARNGEILAAVSLPPFNPNAREDLKESLYRNRAMTEIFEPGSTVKPFVVAAALDGGYVRPNELFVTHGTLQVGRHTVRDVHNYGTMDLTHVIKKSSNVAVSQMALKMPPKYLWDIYSQLGFGASAKAGFPGEAAGRLLHYSKMKDFDRATLSFGYGLSASVVQLARAYTALADDGVLHTVSLLKRDEDPNPVRVFSAKTVKSVRKMMESVIMKDGTAYEARVDGYTVAGKTGTVKKSDGRHGYAGGKYFAVFAGIAPASDPKLIITVMIDEPSAGKYYGGLVSAPVFSRVMSGALRVLDVAPDMEDTMPIVLSRKDASTDGHEID